MKPSDLVQALDDAIALDIPAFVWGPPGVGKSDIVAQVAARHKLELRDVRMAQMDPTDIKGFPAPDAAKNLMRWLPPDFLPTNPKSKGVLFLDELVSAPTAVQASGYQLFLNRAVGNYKLPPGWRIFAAGNRDSDRAVVHRMPSALANRMMHFTLEADPDEWINYAVDNDFDPMVVAFLRFRPGHLFKLDTTASTQAYPTPRSWSYVNRIVKQKLPSTVRETRLIEGAVGTGAALEFAGFMQVAQSLPDIGQISLNPDTAAVPETPAALHAVTTMVSMKTNVGNFSKFMKYIERLPVEFQVVYVRSVVRQRGNEAVGASPTFTAWTIKHDNVIA